MLAKMRNAGEACTAANRYYVEASIADDFADRFAAAMDELRLGPGLDESTDVGPLANRATQQKVTELVDGAVDEDAAIVTGGAAPDGRGFFYQPTVLKNVVRNAHILTQEIFGPVGPIVPFEDLDDAIEMANDTEYGLISYVYTGDTGTGMRVAEALEAGMIAVNRGLVSDPAAPFGGVKQSGLGREGAHHGLLEYVETKFIGVEW